MFVFFAFLIIFCEIFYIRYNQKFIYNYIRLNYPMEKVILNIHSHPLIYVFPIILILITYYFYQIYSLLNFIFVFVIGLLILLLWLFSVIVLSINYCLTNQRVIKLSSIKILKNIFSEFNIQYKNITNLRLYKYGYSTEILIDDDKKRYRLAGISNINKVYDVIKNQIK